MYIVLDVMLPHDNLILLITSVVHHEVSLSALAVGDQKEKEH